MIQVEVSFGAGLADTLGSSNTTLELSQEGATFAELLSLLMDKLPAFKEIAVDPATQRVGDQIVIMVNGRLLDLVGGLQAGLKDGDQVQIFPFLAGG
ncbi:MAG: MoaD family protein [Chloroflexota bacterium]